MNRGFVATVALGLRFRQVPIDTRSFIRAPAGFSTRKSSCARKSLALAAASCEDASFTFNSSRSWPFLTFCPGNKWTLVTKVSNWARTVAGAMGSTLPLLLMEATMFRGPAWSPIFLPPAAAR